MTESLGGALLFNKPAGITSFKAVDFVRKKLGFKKAGHTGTLDPLATGLLIILLGKATKIQSFFLKKDKTYKAKIRLGIQTDTDDMDGEVINSAPFKISAGELAGALNSFSGTITQVPPKYSAISVAGQRLYKLARRGIDVVPPPREVTIYSIKLIASDETSFEVLVSCSSGTYIRSLARDIGFKLGSFGVIERLERTEIPPFHLANAVGREYVESHSVEDVLSKVVPINELNSMINSKAANNADAGSKA